MDWKNWLSISAVLILSGCSSAAIKVTEIDGECVLVGGLFESTFTGEVPPVPENLAYEFRYSGERCEVTVSSATE